jgi:hypothetical protein
MALLLPTRLQSPDGQTTLFVQERPCDHAGNWGVQVDASLPDGAAGLQPVGFQVTADELVRHLPALH